MMRPAASSSPCSSSQLKATRSSGSPASMFLEQPLGTGTDQGPIGGFDLLDDVEGVPPTDVVRSPVVGEQLGAVGPQGLQQHVPTPGHPHDQRALGQLGDRLAVRPGPPT